MIYNIISMSIYSESAISADPETNLLQVDVDDFDEVAAEFGIRAMPTVVFLKDGEG